MRSSHKKMQKIFNKKKRFSQIKRIQKSSHKKKIQRFKKIFIKRNNSHR